LIFEINLKNMQEIEAEKEMKEIEIGIE